MAAVSGGKRGSDRADELLERAAEIAAPLNSTLVDGNINAARAVCAFLQERMQKVLEYSDAFERSYRASSSDDEGEYYHRSAVVAARLTALYVLGRHREGNDELQAALKDARDTENIAALLTLSAMRTRVVIAADRVQDAMTRLAQERAQLPRTHFGLLHVYYLTSLLRIGCATGDYEWSLRLAEGDWERYQRSIFKRTGSFAVIVPALHARFLLNQGLSRKLPPTELAKLVAADLHLRFGLSAPVARAVCLRMRARLAHLAGDRATALQLLGASIPLFDRQMSAEEASRDRYAYGAVGRR